MLFNRYNMTPNEQEQTPSGDNYLLLVLIDVSTIDVAVTNLHQINKTKDHCNESQIFK